MNRSIFLSWPAGRVARAVLVAAGLGVAAAVVPAGAVPALAAAGAAAALPPNCSQSGGTVTCTFGYTGGAQSFTVPAWVHSITVTAAGAQGGYGEGEPGGLGGVAQAAFAVAPGEAVEVLAGGEGLDSTAWGTPSPPGGFNGGGAGGPLGPNGSAGGSSGGGASDVRTGACASTLSCGLTARVLVGGGGGGAGNDKYPGIPGGGGGWQSGGTGGNWGVALGGGGGSQSAGGGGGAGAVVSAVLCPGEYAGGTGQAGGVSTQASGGAGGSAGGMPNTTAAYWDPGAGGAGGGGGYWGGGGGGGGEGDVNGQCIYELGAGGGGGSSFGPAGATFTNAAQSGNGQVTISYNKVTTTTTGGSVPPASPVGLTVTYYATVSPVPDGGTVAFGDANTGTTITGCGAQPVDPSTGTAACQVPENAVGNYWISAVYSGDATYAASTATMDGGSIPLLCLQRVYYNAAVYETAKAHTVQVSLQLQNTAGTNLSAAGIPVTVTGLSPSPARGTAPTGTFTFQTLTQGPGYRLDINTAGYPAGTYTLSFTAGSDPITHTAQFVIS